MPTDTRQLQLHNMLDTPNVTKKLLVVSQFSRDNRVYFEFHPTHCLVRDSLLHRMLLKVIEWDGLYKLDCLVFLR